MKEDILRELCEAWAPVGRTSGLGELVWPRLTESGYHVQQDALGNIIARRGEGAAYVFAVHMDQQCWVVEHRDKKGVLFLRPVPQDSRLGEGWALDKEGRRYRIFSDDAGKVMRAEAVMDELTDTGVFLVPEPVFASSGSKVFSSALGDRLGTALLLELAGDLVPPVRSVVFLFYTGRHLGYSGLLAGLGGVEIERLYFLDTFACGKDTPGLEPGNGAVLMLRTQRSIPVQQWVDEMEAVAETQGVKLQKGFLTDVSCGGDIVSPRGIPSLVLGVCLGYHGSRIERLVSTDYEGLKKCLEALIQGEAKQ